MPDIEIGSKWIKRSNNRVVVVRDIAVEDNIKLVYYGYYASDTVFEFLYSEFANYFVKC